MVEAKISACSCPHFGSNDIIRQAMDWRDIPSYNRRMTEILAASISFDPNVALILGDLVNASSENHLTYLQEYISMVTNITTGLQCPRLDTLGNHIMSTSLPPTYSPIWDGANGMPTMADYFTEIANQTSGVSLTKENYAGPNGQPYFYTADVDGIRYIAFYFPYGGTIAQNELDWLEARLSETSLPVVIFAHAHLWVDPYQELTGGWVVTNVQDIYDIIDQYPVVQLVMGGHRHWHAHLYRRNGVQYLSLGGSCGIRTETSTGTNNYVLIEMKANSVPTPYGMKANLKITGVGTYTQGITKDWCTFGIGA